MGGGSKVFSRTDPSDVMHQTMDQLQKINRKLK